ncbi:MAG: hypothetical protein HY319_16250 [Armatimonadetes bacterium]|nr:hypothetical protein [Armatimonadota bacterium]
MAIFTVRVNQHQVNGNSLYKVTPRMEDPRWLAAIDDNPEPGLACHFGNRYLVHRNDQGQWQPVDRIEQGLQSEQLMDGSYGLWKDARVHGGGIFGFFKTVRPKDGEIQADEVVTFAGMAEQPTEVCGMSWDGVRVMDKMKLQSVHLELDPDHPEKGCLFERWNMVGQDFQFSL